jgi:hypothetical protein
MPRSRPASNLLSFHKPTGQFYVTRGGKRIYLGANRQEALDRYHRLALGQAIPEPVARPAPISAKELANRYIESQKADWRQGRAAERCCEDRLGRFLSSTFALFDCARST